MRFTTLAHADRTILGPLEPAAFDGFLAGLPLAPDARVLDIGCGKGDLLVRLARRGATVTGTGVDRNPWFLAEARGLAEAAGVGERLAFELADADPATLPRGLDLVACVGATGALGGPDAAPAALTALVREGGLVLVGEGFWRVPPEPAWLNQFGIEPGEMRDRDATIARLAAPGLEPLLTLESDEAGWDAYEEAYAGAIEGWAARHPDDPEREAFFERAAFMRDTYAAWRRRAMGFLLVALRA